MLFRSLGNRILQQFVIRVMCLYQHLSWLVCATSTTGDLQDQLCHTFRTSKVGAEQTLITIKDRNQSQMWEMMALGQ